MLNPRDLAHPEISTKDLEPRREVMRLIREVEQAPLVAAGAVASEATRSEAVSSRTQRRGQKDGSQLSSEGAYGFGTRRQRGCFFADPKKRSEGWKPIEFRRSIWLRNKKREKVIKEMKRLELAMPADAECKALKVAGDEADR
jgi:hypothetical protein